MNESNNTNYTDNLAQELIEKYQNHPNQKKNNPNHKGVAGQRQGLKEVIGSNWYIAKANLIRHNRRISVQNSAKSYTQSNLMCV